MKAGSLARTQKTTSQPLGSFEETSFPPVPRGEARWPFIKKGFWKCCKSWRCNCHRERFVEDRYRARSFQRIWPNKEPPLPVTSVWRKIHKHLLLLQFGLVWSVLGLGKDIPLLLFLLQHLTSSRRADARWRDLDCFCYVEEFTYRRKIILCGHKLPITSLASWCPEKN